MRILLFSLSFLFISLSFSQKEQAFVIYKSNGKKASYKQMKALALENQLVFFGEFHDNPISHWLQFELMLDLFAQHQSNLVLSFEMFEQDQQAILNDYLNGKLSDKQFKDSCRLWPNYETDYKPLLDFAKEKQLKVIAANIQRKYASLLFKKGRAALDTLSPLIKSQMAAVDFPVDTTLSQYQVVKEMGAHMGANMVEAQAIKDATMAKFILAAMKNETRILHFNGAFHTDFKQGILWYIWKEKPEAKIMTISTVTQNNIYKLEKENSGKADFIICVPETMTRTH
jgi:uncharacterized iron-regulated protein